MAELTILLSSHNFAVARITPRGRAAVESFAKKFVQFGFQRSQNNKYVHTALKVFAAATQDRSEYRFHINCFKQFQQHLELHYLIGDLVEFIQLPIPTPVEVSLVVQPHWKDFDYQVPVIEYLTKSGDPVLKLAALRTGAGKGYVSMRAMSILGYRTLIVVKPMLLEKWQIELGEIFELVPEDLMVVRGSSQLIALLMLANTGKLHSKVILLSTKTMQNWIKLYEKFKEETLDLGYVCTPDRLCEILGAGVRLSDELHMEFHSGWKIDMYTNVKHSIALSATLISDDDFMNRMYEIAYPAVGRYSGGPSDKYIASIAVIYRLKYPNKIRTKDPGSNNYSHHVFEQCIMRSSELCSNYLGLINETIKNSYLKDYKKGQRLLVFCASIDMCTLVTAYLKKQYLNYDVRRYCEADEFENLMTADISVSTVQSAGTAVDIPMLTTVIMTTAISSIQSNIQSFGRLRKLKDGTTPEFFYFVCQDVDTHLKYHEKKRVILQDRALSYRSIFVGPPI